RDARRGCGSAAAVTARRQPAIHGIALDPVVFAVELGSDPEPPGIVPGGSRTVVGRRPIGNLPGCHHISTNLDR
ncbi:MAG TPA: hypothetical protein VNF04_02215, partial [Stellaceae bacterium]|nr:hypothetical protein [Stellaceae bacterium]